MSEIPALDLLIYVTSFGAFPRGRHDSPQTNHEFEDDISIELRRKFKALKCFRRGCNDDPCLLEAFWVALLMIIDGDVKSHEQLRRAGLPALLKSFIRHRMYDGSEANHDWPVETEINCLALALLWYSSSETSVNAEPLEERHKIMENIRPFVYAGFRYPLFDYKECHPKLNSCSVVIGNSTRVPYPPSRPTCHVIQYFGKRTAPLRVPPISIFATLCYFSRLESTPHMIPPHLAANRAEADAAHRVGPTREDCEQFINTCRTRFPRNSLTHPEDARRNGHHPPSPSSPISELFISRSPGYALGSMTGRWKGSSIQPCRFKYADWLANATAPLPLPKFGRQPLYCTLREHFCCDQSSLVPSLSGKDSDGIMNACLPSGCQWVENETGIRVFDTQQTYSTNYETFRPDDDPSDPKFKDIVDVIVTGETDPVQATAWGAFKFFGRIRLSDGLVVMSRESLEGLGTDLLRGYLISSQNFTGRYRGQADDGCPAGWEAPFSLCKGNA